MFDTTIKSTQDQAIGAWVDYLNQVRLTRLVETLSQQDLNLQDSLSSIEWAFSTIQESIIGRNRGGEKGMHGFIAEVAECGIGNARQQIVGDAATHIWIDDNGPIDILRGLEPIQQKFVQSGGHLSLNAILVHLEHYPNYVRNGGRYQIPRDHFDKIVKYLSIPKSVADKMPTSTGEFSLKQWREVHSFFETSGLSIDDLEASIFDYGDVQAESIIQTLDREQEGIRKTDRDRRVHAYEESKPTFQEGVKAASVSAGIEGLSEFCFAILRKKRRGKKIKDFDREDWLDIAGHTGEGFVKGGVRGASIYLLTNYSATPGAVASAFVTASFGVADQINRYRKGLLTEIQFIENAEALCLEASVSALSSLVGQVLIPIPVLGAVIGNAIGSIMLRATNGYITAKEKEILDGYIADLSELDTKLQAEYRECIIKLNQQLDSFVLLLEAAFSQDITVSLKGSVDLAKAMGVPAEDILDSHKKVVTYFTD